MRRLLVALLLTGCGGVSCGPGTEVVSGVCLPIAPPPTPAAPLPLPPLSPGEFAERPRPIESALVVVVLADGSLTIDGEPVPDAALEDRARDYLGQHPADGSALVESHPDAPPAGVTALLDRLSLVGITHVSLRTTP